MSREDYYCGVEVLKGKTLTKVQQTQECEEDQILFETSDGGRYLMHHEQDCRESVYISDICGDLQDLVGGLVILAEESQGELLDCCESGTWTFYRIDTTKGFVTIRWNGESDGYYSESVDFVDLSKNRWD